MNILQFVYKLSRGGPPKHSSHLTGYPMAEDVAAIDWARAGLAVALSLCATAHPATCDTRRIHEHYVW
jgi:hypothetical protein